MSSLDDLSVVSRIFPVSKGEIKIEDVFEELMVKQKPFQKRRWSVECAALIYDGPYHFFHPATLVCLVSNQITFTTYMDRQLEPKFQVVLSGTINSDGIVLFHGSKSFELTQFSNSMEFYVTRYKPDEKPNQDDRKVYEIMTNFTGYCHLIFSRL